MRESRKSVATLLTIVFIGFMLSNARIGLSDNPSREIDLYSQKYPHNGRGANVASDAFGPGEEVNVNALVTYNGYPLHSLLVGFGIYVVSDLGFTMTFYRTAYTDLKGVATISFEISYLNETTFGVWDVTANANVYGKVVQDTMSFKVGWIVQIVSMRTKDSQCIDQDRFTRGSCIGIELGLKSIAMTYKLATLAVAIYDCLGTPLNVTEQRDFDVPANETITYACFFLSIPKNSQLGPAIAYSNAFTASVQAAGVPWCPEKSKAFLIVTRNVAIKNVHVSPSKVFKGETVNVGFTVANEGSEPESVSLNVYGNGTALSTSQVADLESFSEVVVKFVWNTSSAVEGVYSVSAAVSELYGEVSLMDNTFVDGFVEVRSPFHDVAVVSVAPSVTTACVGDTIDVFVTVRNQGNWIESFDVSVSYDSYAIDAIHIASLEPSIERSFIVHWSTSGIVAGNYTLKAMANVVDGELYVENNSYVDGVVRLLTRSCGWYVPRWFWWFLLLLLLLVLLLLLLLHYRKRKEDSDEMFYFGWASWYYGYDIRSKAARYKAGLGRSKAERLACARENHTSSGCKPNHSKRRQNRHQRHSDRSIARSWSCLKKDRLGSVFVRDA